MDELPDIPNKAVRNALAAYKEQEAKLATRRAERDTALHELTAAKDDDVAAVAAAEAAKRTAPAATGVDKAEKRVAECERLIPGAERALADAETKVKQAISSNIARIRDEEARTHEDARAAFNRDREALAGSTAELDRTEAKRNWAQKWPDAPWNPNTQGQVVGLSSKHTREEAATAAELVEVLATRTLSESG